MRRLRGSDKCVLRGRRNESVIAWLGCLAIFRVRATFHALLAVYRCEMIAGAAFCDIYMPVLRRESMVKICRYANICIHVYVNMSKYMYVCK